MISRFLLAAVMAGLALPGLAQGRFSAAITGAGIANASQVHEADISSSSFRNSPFYTAMGGVVLAYRIRPNLFVESGYQLSGIGFKPRFYLESVGSNRNSVSVQAGFTVHSIPVHARYVSPRPVLNSWHVYLLAGSTVTFRSGGTRVLASSNIGVSNPNFPLLNDSLVISMAVSPSQNVVVGFSGGFGIEKPLRNSGRAAIGVLFNRNPYQDNPLFTASVEYKAYGKTYKQRLLNHGNYAGVHLTYFFPAFGTQKLEEEGI